MYIVNIICNYVYVIIYNGCNILITVPSINCIVTVYCNIKTDYILNNRPW